MSRRHGGDAADGALLIRPLAGAVGPAQICRSVSAKIQVWLWDETGGEPSDATWSGEDLEGDGGERGGPGQGGPHWEHAMVHELTVE